MLRATPLFHSEYSIIPAKRATSRIFIALAFVSSGCASVTVTSNPPEASVSIETPNGEKTSLGQTPFSSSLGEVADKAENSPVVLVVEKEGFTSDKVLIPSWQFGSLDLTFELKAATKPEQEKKEQAELGPGAINEPFRLIMLAHKALVEGQYEYAIQTAGEVEKLNPKLAAPLLIQGIAEIKRSNTEKAKALFEKAKRLDPQDPAIDQLMDLTTR